MQTVPFFCLEETEAQICEMNSQDFQEWKQCQVAEPGREALSFE